MLQSLAAAIVSMLADKVIEVIKPYIVEMFAAARADKDIDKKLEAFKKEPDAKKRAEIMDSIFNKKTL
jgi:hypothetical protein